MDKLRNILRPADALVAAAILLLAGAILAGLWWAGRGEAAWAVVTLDNQILTRLPLAEDQRMEIQVPHGTAVIEISGGRARVAAADCPDQVCVQTGWLEKNGQVAVCVPNRLVLEIENGQDDGVDILVQ